MADPATRRPRVLYVVRGFPQISQTYVKWELEAVAAAHDVKILSRKPANRPYAHHRPWTDIRSMEEAVAEAEAFRPDVIHTHYLNQVEFVAELSRRVGVPYTVRSHSFDVMTLRRPSLMGQLKRFVPRHRPTYLKGKRAKRALPLLNEDNCLGCLAFPFARPLLEKNGVEPGKIVDCYPVVKVAMFKDHGPNGRGVMNVGAAIPKKKMEDFLRLASLVEDVPFTLYAMGYGRAKLEEAAKRSSASIEVKSEIEPEDMPAEYKKHDWLVYTADFDLKSVGWPMAVAEAQAAGVGVCMPNIRPDVAAYIGEGGILYDRIEDVAPLLVKPPSEDLKARGYVQSEKSDIDRHIHLLTDLWTPYLQPGPTTYASTLADTPT
jgi:hypothetical protein